MGCTTCGRDPGRTTPCHECDIEFYDAEVEAELEALEAENGRLKAALVEAERKRDQAEERLKRSDQRAFGLLKDKARLESVLSEANIKLGRAEGALETEKQSRLVESIHCNSARAIARRLWRFCLSWAPVNDAWRDVKHECQTQAIGWINE